MQFRVKKQALILITFYFGRNNCMFEINNSVVYIKNVEGTNSQMTQDDT